MSRREDPHRFGRRARSWPRVSVHAAVRYVERVRPDISIRLAFFHLEGLMVRRRSALRPHDIADDDEVWELVEEPGVALVVAFDKDPKGCVVTVLTAREREERAAEE